MERFRGFPHRTYNETTQRGHRGLKTSSSFRCSTARLRKRVSSYTRRDNLPDCQGEILDAGHRYRTIMEFVGLHPDTRPFLWKPEPDASSRETLSPEEQRAVSDGLAG